MDDYLGAYVIHALERHEVSAVEAHLATCRECADEVDSLTVTVSRLALLSTAEVEEVLGLEAVAPVPAPDGAPRTRPARRRTVLVAAAAVAAAVAAGVVAGDLAAPPPRSETLHGSDAGTAVSAALTVTARPSGTALHLSLRGAYPRGECSLVVRARDGRSEVAATWMATAGGAAEVEATTSMARDQVRAFDVMTPSGRRLIRLVMPRRPR
jgi:hypothetical protein